jgi:uncharacterized RDD family membrane protein YckC
MTQDVTSRKRSSLALDPPVYESDVQPHLEAVLEESPPRGSLSTESNPTELADDQWLQPNSWRSEVTARLERYRTRRKPKAPKYPSLLLPFDAPECRSRFISSALPISADVSAQAGLPAFAAAYGFRSTDSDLPGAIRVDPTQADSETAAERPDAPEFSAKVIEFPRSDFSSSDFSRPEFPCSAAIPASHTNELAEPVFDFNIPRIVEAPEILPPPPALGGILIEPAERSVTDPQIGAVRAPVSASLARRALAAVLDGFIVLLMVASIAAIFLRFNPAFLPSSTPGLLPARATLLLVAGLFGCLTILLAGAFQYAFVVYTGATPGMSAAGLRLERLDGASPDRRLRRWRVLASFLSAFSVGLGYVWCLLDENGLSWHDRITHTHVCNR